MTDMRDSNKEQESRAKGEGRLALDLGPTWSQPPLWGRELAEAAAPAAWEARLWIGCVPSTDHWQLMVESYDPATRVQHSLWSCPHTTGHGVLAAVQEAMARLLTIMADEVEPF